MWPILNKQYEQFKSKQKSEELFVLEEARPSWRNVLCWMEDYPNVNKYRKMKQNKHLGNG